jgi:hypothetical protein
VQANYFEFVSPQTLRETPVCSFASSASFFHRRLKEERDGSWLAAMSYRLPLFSAREPCFRPKALINDKRVAHCFGLRVATSADFLDVGEPTACVNAPP